MAEHPIQGLMNVTMEKIHQMVDSNTVVGEPINTADGVTLIPVSRLSFGFGCGGGGASHQQMHFAEASHSRQRFGNRISGKLATIHIGQKENSHQITPASSLSFAISSSTEATLTPAFRPAGSEVFTTVRRGVTSTP